MAPFRVGRRVTGKELGVCVSGGGGGQFWYDVRRKQREHDCSKNDEETSCLGQSR